MEVLVSAGAGWGGVPSFCRPCEDDMVGLLGWLRPEVWLGEGRLGSWASLGQWGLACLGRSLGGGSHCFAATSGLHHQPCNELPARAETRWGEMKVVIAGPLLTQLRLPVCPSSSPCTWVMLAPALTEQEGLSSQLSLIQPLESVEQLVTC